MAGEWTTLPLEDCMAAIIDYRGKSPEKTTFGVPLVTAKIVKGGRIEKPEEFIAEADFDDWMRRGMPKPGDVVMTTEAPLGEVAQLDGRKVALAQRVITLRGKPDVLDNTFLKFLLQSNPVQEELRSRGTGTTVVGIRQSELRKVSLTLPPLAEQKGIAAVLGALDDKIELNRRMNATLEAMARALFQSWFVDFDPVRAKLDGRSPAALDPATAALFPDSFDETELGHIPHGWIAGNFGEIIAAERERIGASDAVVLSAVASSQLVRSDEHFNKQVYSKSISNYLKVRHWDFAYNPSRINIGSIGMLKEGVIGAVSPVYEVFRPKAAYHWFVERSLAQPDTKLWIQTLCSGSVRQSLKLRDLESIPLVVPPPPIVHAFNKTWEQWHDLIQANERESRTLATLRDTLLPKLLSGELSIN
jgi:type I restriction enzyme S subunit